MSVDLSPVGGAAAQFFDNNGNPLSGGKLFTYAAGTTTPQVTYTTSTGNVAHTNPIILDSAGRIPGNQIWVDTVINYKFTLENSAGAVVWTVDNILGGGTIAGVDFSTGLVTATGTTTARSLADHFANVTHASDFSNLVDYSVYTTDGEWSAAILAAINRAIDESTTFKNGHVVLPPGDLYIDADALFSSFTGASQFGLLVSGSGRRGTRLILVSDAGSRWFYDNGASNPKLGYVLFQHLGFQATAKANGNGFRLTSELANLHEQNFAFHDCEFRNLNVVFATEGTGITSECRWYTSKFHTINTVMVLNNEQTVNLEFHGCDAEVVASHFITVGVGGGGGVDWFGGSIISDGAATSTQWLINATGSSFLTGGNRDFNFYGVRTELRSVNAGLVRCTELAGRLDVHFYSCNFANVAGGNRTVVDVGANKTVTFHGCDIPSTFLYRLELASGSIGAVDHSGLVRFESCALPINVSDKITLSSSYGRAIGRNCTVQVTGSTNYAADFDYNWENSEQGGAGAQKKVATIHMAARAWPVSTTERTVVLPAGAMIMNLYILRPVGGSGSVAYQLRVGNGDKSVTYGTSTLGVETNVHSIEVLNLKRQVGTTTNERTVRLWADPPGSNAVAGGGYAIVEYI
jgi:hypothetical protein